MKKSLRLLSLALSGMMLLGAASCGAKTEPTKATEAATKATEAAKATEATKAASGEKAKIAFIAADMSNASQAYSSKMFQKYAADYNFDVVILDAKGDVQQESQLVTNAIAQGIKAIYLNPNDINAIIPSIKQAKEKGMIVGMFSSDLPADAQQYRDFFCGVNDTQAGEAAAEAFLKQFPDGAKIVEVGGQAGHDAQIKRHDGFNKKIAGSKIEVLEYQTPQQWDTTQAMTIMEDMITKHGKDIQGVFCHWDNGVTGVIEALKGAGIKENIFVVGVDGNKNGFTQVKEGSQTVCIAQSFENMTKKSLECTRNVMDGKTVEKINFIPLDIVSKANIDTFPMPEW